MSLSTDQKLVNLTQYKELAAKVGVARYGSKTDLVSRIKGVSGGKDKLQTLIAKAKKSIVVRKKKKVVGSPLKKTPTKCKSSKDDDGVTTIIVGITLGVLAILLTAVTYIALKTSWLEPLIKRSKEFFARKRFGKKQVLPGGVKAAPQKGSGSNKVVPGPIES